MDDLASARLAGPDPAHAQRAGHPAELVRRRPRDRPIGTGSTAFPRRPVPVVSDTPPLNSAQAMQLRLLASLHVIGSEGWVSWLVRLGWC